MRILHSSDWHLGRRLYGYGLLEDQAVVLDQFCTMASDSRPDLIVLAGDLYDIANPPADAVRLMNDVLTRLKREVKCPVVVISGNHDSAERIGFASELLEESGLWMVGGLSRMSSPLRLRDGSGTVAIHPLPFVDSLVIGDWLRRNDPERQASLYGGQWGSLLDVIRSGFRAKERNVLITHAAVSRGIRSESEREIGTADIVDPAQFFGFDYVALGHLHRPQTVGEERLRYSGSLLKYSESEAGQTKSAALVEMDGQGQLHTELLPFSPRRELRLLSGSYLDLSRGRPPDVGAEDYVFFRFSESVPEPEAEAVLRRLYLNFMNVRWSTGVADSAEPALHLLDAVEVDDMELFRVFFKHTMDADLEPGMPEILERAMALVDRAEEDA